MKNTSFATGSVDRFLRELGSVSTAPGGGAAAALTAASGAALIEMVIRLNDKRLSKKKKISSAEHLAKLAGIRRSLVGLIGQDAKAFSRIYAYWKAKDFGAGYQKALIRGASIPLEICRQAGRALELAMPEKQRTSPWLMSDLKEAGILLQAAFRSARLNVDINLGGERGVQDKRFVKKTRQELNDIRFKIEKILGALDK